jgi:hypothetical protein
VGDCVGGEGDSRTEFAEDWEPELAAELVPGWLERGYLSGTLIAVDELVSVIDAVLRSGTSLSMLSVTVTPRPDANEST